MPEPIEEESNNQASRRRIVSIAWVPTIKLTAMFYVCAFSAITLGTALYLSWTFLIPSPAQLTPESYDFTTGLVKVISFLIVSLGLVSFVLSLRYSHRVTGPMVAIGRHVDSMIKGD